VFSHQNHIIIISSILRFHFLSDHHDTYIISEEAPVHRIQEVRRTFGIVRREGQNIIDQHVECYHATITLSGVSIIAIQEIKEGGREDGTTLW
jgi:hypothetical protein